MTSSCGGSLREPAQMQLMRCSPGWSDCDSPPARRLARGTHLTAQPCGGTAADERRAAQHCNTDSTTGYLAALAADGACFVGSPLHCRPGGQRSESCVPRQAASCSAMTANHRDFVAAPPTCTPPPQHWKLPGIELVEASASQPQMPARTLLSQQKVVAYLFHLLGDHLFVDHHAGSREDVGAS
jgi:hypothetical protein